MPTSLTERTIPTWTHSISPRQAGLLLLILAPLLTLASYILQTTLNYPEILLDQPSLANSLLAQEKILILLAFLGLLLSGILLFIISLGLLPHLEAKQHRRVLITGTSSSTFLTLAALLDLLLIPLWASTLTNVAHILATTSFVLSEIAVPLLLLFWTLSLARSFRTPRLLSSLAVIGLLLLLLRSLLWTINAILPIETGFYATAGIINVLTVLAISFWLVWLLMLAFRLLNHQTESTETASTALPSQPVKRRTLLKFGIGLGLGITTGAFALTRTSLTVLNPPTLEGEDVPSEPSLLGTLFYLLLTTFLKLNPITTVAQERAQSKNATPQPLPANISLEQVNASGVPAQIIRAPNAVSSRAILHIHGGGWAVPSSDQDLIADASLSQATGAWVLLPNYRLAPEDPFPAGLSDCVTAYRWLRKQGIAASQILIIGGSAGGNLALATVLSLRESGDALPAVVITESAPTDLAMTGETYTTKASVDPVLGSGLAKNSYIAYTSNNSTDLRNPLISPLYADMHGFPPTLMQVGTQEVLLSDSTRMAERLKAAGTEVKLEIWPGMFHGWRGQTILPESRLATTHILKFIHQHLGW